MEEIKQQVQKNYGAVASNSTTATSGGCCSPSAAFISFDQLTQSQLVGYSTTDLNSVPAEANLGLGCGNPVAFADLQTGEIVLDLGAGAGLDCFLAAQQVGATGRVIGIDMTPEMVARAQANAKQGGFHNVEFRLGEIEQLPVDDASIDIIISNCVINLAPDKAAVFAEAYRVLKPNGRLFVSDIVLLKPLADVVQNSALAYSGCVAGALLKDDYLAAIHTAGFAPAIVHSQTPFPVDFLTSDPAIQTLSDTNPELTQQLLADTAAAVVSIKIKAVKPAV